MSRTDRQSTTFSGPVLRGELNVFPPTYEAADAVAADAKRGMITDLEAAAIAGRVIDVGTYDGIIVVPFAASAAFTFSHLKISRLYPVFDEAAVDFEDPAGAWLEIPVVIALSISSSASSVGISAAAAALRSELLATDELAGLGSITHQADAIIYAEFLGTIMAAIVPAHGAKKMLIETPPSTANTPTTNGVLATRYTGGAMRA